MKQGEIMKKIEVIRSKNRRKILNFVLYIQNGY